MVDSFLWGSTNNVVRKYTPSLKLTASLPLKMDGWNTIWVFPKIGVPQNHPFNRVFHYFHHPFWGPIPPIFGTTHIVSFWGAWQRAYFQGANLLACWLRFSPSIHPSIQSPNGIDRTDENSRPKVLDVDFGPCVAGTTGMTSRHDVLLLFCFELIDFFQAKMVAVVGKRVLKILASWCQNQPKEISNKDVFC